MTVENMFFRWIYQTFKPRYILLNTSFVIKHHWKNFYPEFHKPVGSFIYWILTLINGLRTKEQKNIKLTFIYFSHEAGMCNCLYQARKLQPNDFLPLHFHMGTCIKCTVNNHWWYIIIMIFNILWCVPPEK